MPRWLYAILCLILFTIAIAIVRIVLHAMVPGGIDWLAARVGTLGVWLLLLAIIIPAGIYGHWPRDAAGARRPLLPRRR